MAKKVKETKAKPAPAAPKVDELAKVRAKREQLIAEIRPKLMSTAQLKRGGGNTRVLYEREKGFLPVIAEINELGKQLGYRPIGLGHLRG